MERLHEPSPLPGLCPYTLTHAPLFAGRNAVIGEIIAQLQTLADKHYPCLVVSGQSGSGKTSLLQAGILPRLLAEEDTQWRYASLHARTADVFGQLSEALLQALPELSETQSFNADELMQLLREHPDTVRLLLRTTCHLLSDLSASQSAASEKINTPTKIILFIDPLEDFLLEELTPTLRHQFIYTLKALLASDHVWIIAALDERATRHFLEGQTVWLELFATAGHYPLPPPNIEDIQEIIQRTLELTGLTIKDNESPLISQIVQATLPTLPTLSAFNLGLQQLHQHREGQYFTAAAWQQTPISEQLIAQQLELFYQQLSPELQTIVAELWRALLQPSPIGSYRLRYVSERRLIRSEWHQQLIEHLLQRGYLILDQRHYLQLSHLVLIENWPRAQQFLTLNTLQMTVPQSRLAPRAESRSSRLIQKQHRQQLMAEASHKLLGLMHNLFSRWHLPARPITPTQEGHRGIMTLSLIGGMAVSGVLLGGYGWAYFKQQQEVTRENQHALALSYQQVGGLQQRLGQSSAALQAYQQAYSLLHLLESTLPTVRLLAETGLNVGDIYQQQGEWQQALQHYRQVQLQLQNALQQSPHSSEFNRLLIRSLQQQGDLQRQLGHLSSAIHFYQNALDHLELWANQDQQSLRIKATLHQTIAQLLDRLNQNQSALSHYQKAQQLFQQLAQYSSEQSLQDQAESYRQIAQVQHSLGQLDLALISYQKALALREKINQDFPSNEAQWALADTHRHVAEVYQKQANYPSALEQAEKALVLWQKQIYQPDHLAALHALAELYDLMGQIHFKNEAFASALTQHQNALNTRQLLATRIDSVNLRDWALTYDYLAKTYLALEQPEDALTAYRQSLALTEQLAQHDQENLTLQRDLSISYEQVGDVESLLKNKEAALIAYQQSLTLAQQLAERRRIADDDPLLTAEKVQQQRDLAISHDKVAKAQQDLYDYEAALTHYRAALSLREELSNENIALQREKLFSWFKIGDLLRLLDRTAEARAAYQSALGIAQTLAERQPNHAQTERDLATIQQRLERLN
jgi:tetratricopeptide (TPR) repeat protein